MIYADSSALMKLLIIEPETAALGAWLEARSDTPVVSSQLTIVEVIRSCRRANADALPAARILMSTLDLIPISREVVDAAAELSGTLLRSLDAIHLATAVTIGAGLTQFLSYDRRLTESAQAAGMVTAQPGG